MNELKMPRGWQLVDMPERIDALPRERRGFPIPYVAEYPHGEGLEYHAGWAKATCDCKTGVNNPLLGSQCPERQRECMENSTCQVCHVKIEGKKYFIGGEGGNDFIEPPLHQECALYSLQVCPGLAKKESPDVPHNTVTVYECDRYACLVNWNFKDGKEILPMNQLPLLIMFGLDRAIVDFYVAVLVNPTIYTKQEFIERFAK